MKLMIALLAAASLLGPVGPVHAHHSFNGTFQEGKTIQVTGVVSEFHFFNPHVAVYFNVTQADGSVTKWMSEGNAASNYVRLGWTAETLRPGDTVRISGDATRDGSPMVTMGRVELLNAQDLSVARVLTDPRSGTAQGNAQRASPSSFPARLADGRPNLSAAWTEGERQRFPTVPYNDAGKARQVAAKIADDPQTFCEPPGLVRQAGATPHAIRITQLPDRVLIEYEEYGGRREIPIGAGKPMPGVKTRLGTSVARYEGDALVIETVGLSGNWISPHGDQLSDQTTTAETYRRIDDPAQGPMLSIRLVATDPVNLREPFVISKSKRYGGNYQFIANECRPPLRDRAAAPAAR